MSYGSGAPPRRTRIVNGMIVEDAGPADAGLRDPPRAAAGNLFAPAAPSRVTGVPLATAALAVAAGVALFAPWWATALLVAALLLVLCGVVLVRNGH